MFGMDPEDNRNVVGLSYIVERITKLPTTYLHVNKDNNL